MSPARPLTTHPAGSSPTVTAIGDDYVAKLVILDPVFATMAGLGHDDALPDWSPEGDVARHELARRTRAALDRAEITTDRDRIAAELMRERLTVQLELAEAGEHLRLLRSFFCPVQLARLVFDLMPTSTDADWEVIARRMRAVPTALHSFEQTLRLGIGNGTLASRRQAEVCGLQARAWSGAIPGTPSFFAVLATQYRASPAAKDPLADELDTAAAAAAAAYAGLERFLHEEYAAAAPDHDGVGADRYRLWARNFLGAEIDLAATYEWGWEELCRIEFDMAATAARIGHGSLRQVIARLETDPALAIVGEEAFRDWLQDLMDRTVLALDGRYFDIPAPLRTVQAMIAPPGGAAAMYYTPPSEDFTRPGRTWYPTLGRHRFPLWGEVSIAYHESVPGHHLQLGTQVYLREALSRFQRFAGFVSGHVEGWALYAERLMAELGFFEEPHFELGMLRAQALRAMRVVVDIGIHLGWSPPAGIGRKWTYDMARAFVLDHGWFPADFLVSEVDRYLGTPAQAVSYKVGERVWLEAREHARTVPGFDVKTWHQRALALGSLGLDQLARELTAVDC